MLFPRLEYALPKERLATEAQSARETPRTPKTEDRMPAQPQKMKFQKRVGSEDCPEATRCGCVGSATWPEPTRGFRDQVICDSESSKNNFSPAFSTPASAQTPSSTLNYCVLFLETLESFFVLCK